MKRMIKFGWLFCSLLMTACFEDKSAMDVELFKPLVIHNFSTSDMIYIAQGERLKVSVIAYKEGTDDAKLSYEWRLEGHGQHLTLGNTMVLDTVINVPINKDPYSLLFTVTDTEYDLCLTKKYSLYVSGAYVPGLLIADTRDEVTSDLHLLTSENFTSDYNRDEDEYVFWNIYSLNNGMPIDGLVTEMKHVVGRGYLTLTIATEHSIADLNSLENFTVLRENEGMFTKPFEEGMNVGELEQSSLGPYEYVIVNGKLHRKYQYEDAPTYGVGILLTDLTDNYYMTHICIYPSSTGIFGVAWDKLNQRFLAIPNYRDNEYIRIFQHKSADGLLDPNHPGNMDCKYIGHAANSTMYAVLQDNDTKQYEVWVFNMMTTDKDADDVVLKRYILDRCPEIDKALYFSSQPIEDILYYATADKVYTALMVSDHPNAYLKYTAPAGEEITEIRVVDKCVGKVVVPGSGTEESTTLSSSQNMMTVVTYDGQEGKITVIPILSLNTGEMVQDPAYYRIYDGFGRILKTICYHTR